jgi:hypothetical protein
VERNQTKNRIIVAREVGRKKFLISAREYYVSIASVFLQEILGELGKIYEFVTTQLELCAKCMEEIVQCIGTLFRITDYNGTVSVLELLGKGTAFLLC